MVRAFLFFLICVVGFLAPWEALLVCAALYAFRYPAYELLFLGAALDVSYGLGALGIPFPFLYTACAAIIIFLGAVLRPRLQIVARHS